MQPAQEWRGRSLPEDRVFKRVLMGTPNGEPQESSRNKIEYEDPGRYIPSIFLPYSWGSLFGVPSKVPLVLGKGGSAGSL